MLPQCSVKCYKEQKNQYNPACETTFIPPPIDPAHISSVFPKWNQLACPQYPFLFVVAKYKFDWDAPKLGKAKDSYC